MKKIGILFVIIVLAMLFVVSASALEPTGQCGDDVYWEYDESTGELVISGEGEMLDYDFESSPFRESEIKSIVFNDGVISIGANAFIGCDRLTSLMIDGSITKINDSAFFACYKLKSVIIGDGVTTIGRYAFAYCPKLMSVLIGNGITAIDDSAFEHCLALKDIFIPGNVTSIGRYAFSNCDNLENITVDINNKYYSSDEYGVLFNKDKSILLQYPIGNTRTSYTIPNSVSSIGDSAFQHAKYIADITIPDNVTSIGHAVFLGTAYYKEPSNWEEGALYIDKHLVEVNSISSETFTIKSGTLTISIFAFRDICNPTSIIIPDSIVSIGYGVSRYFTKLSDVYYGGTRSQWLKINIASDNYKLNSATRHYHFEKPHTYNAIIINPACTTQGYTTYTCECGDTYVADYVDAKGHNHTSDVTTPTCTTQGYTTYTCECGDTYVADYVDENGHTFSTYISDGKATCITDGLLIAKCDNCDATDSIPEKGGHSFRTDWTLDVEPTCTDLGSKSHHCNTCDEKAGVTPIAKIGHTYTSYVTEPTCTDKGLKVNICSCGDNYTEVLPAKGHTFSGSICKTCGYDKADSCSCNCHKSGLSALLWKILNIFYKLFKLNSTCNCGVAHY